MRKRKAKSTSTPMFRVTMNTPRRYAPMGGSFAPVRAADFNGISSDGALVRGITMVPEGQELAEADQRLQDFVDEFYPEIEESIPGR